jgi:hypothetical protein
MTEQEQFDSFMKLAQFCFERWQERRTYEWKVSLGLWAVLIGAPSYLKAQGVAFSWWATGLVLTGLVIGHAWFWVRNNWISNQMDIKTAFHFVEHAERLLTGSGREPEERLHPEQFRKSCSPFEFLSYGACQSQVFATAFLAFGLFLVLTFK